MKLRHVRAEGTLQMDFEDLYRAICAVAGIPDGAEVVISDIRSVDDWFEVDYAWSIHCHPSDWGVPPKFLQKAGAGKGGAPVSQDGRATSG